MLQADSKRKEVFQTVIDFRDAAQVQLPNLLALWTSAVSCPLYLFLCLYQLSDYRYVNTKGLVQTN